MYSILYSPAAWNDIQKLPIDVAKNIVNSIKEIRANPKAHLKKLRGSPKSPLYSLRVGDTV